MASASSSDIKQSISQRVITNGEQIDNKPLANKHLDSHGEGKTRGKNRVTDIFTPLISAQLEI